MAALLALLALTLDVHAGAMASSFKPEHKMGMNTYNAQAAIDGKYDTPWQVDPESENVGEWIELDVPKTKLDKLGMMIGWGGDEEKFGDYARVKTVEISARYYNEANELVSAGPPVTATFEDKMEFQVVDVDDIQIGQDLFGGKVKITVKEIYPGKDYPNLAVGEVLLVMSEFDAAPTLQNPSSEEADHLIIDMVDDSDKTMWVGDSEGASFEVEAGGYSLARVGLKAGPTTHDRPKKVRITANRRPLEVELKDSQDTQWIEIPAVVGFTGSAYGTILVEILEVYPGTKEPGKLGIREFDAKATAFEG